MNDINEFPDKFLYLKVGDLEDKGYWGVWLHGKQWHFYLNAETSEVDFQPNGVKGLPAYIYDCVRRTAVQFVDSIARENRCPSRGEKRALSALGKVMDWCKAFSNMCPHTAYSDWGTGAVCCKQCAAMGRWVNGTVVW